MKKKLSLFCGFILLAFSINAVAAERIWQPESVISQQQTLRPDLEAGKGAYSKLSPAQRSALLAQQDRLLHLLQTQSPPATLDEQQRNEVFAAIDAIDAAAVSVAAENDEETLVCKREKALGSNFPTRVCRTKSQMRRDQDMANGKLSRGSE